MEVVGARIAEGADADVGTGGQHPGELRDVDTGAAVNGRGEFFGNNVYSHTHNVAGTGKLT
ncbi:hypothetical protein GCM10008096_06040 [Zhihengliuella salsuginis]|uniref:Uncharacterized protein n=1 Tax=Zhihengliuella salsuginis TaxID=578222 RepID=A0ABQ3GF47_9MICC|nr:hypothetical protein GCM10008096_06040 [Zhihengliuella salsuginis]